MSGATMATGTRENQGKNHKGEPKPLKGKDSDVEGAVGGIMGSLRIVELQLVAFIIVFSASGLVPVQDLVFPVIITAYSFFLSGAVFPSYGAGKVPDVFKGNRFFQLYVILGTAIGLFMPLAYVLGGFSRGDRQAVKDASPHLFLLSFQILSENIVSSLGIFSLPVRALLPILYTTRRLFSLSEWIVDTFTHPSHSSAKVGLGNPMFPDSTWAWFGRGLAIANTIYFSINLFGFLLPLFLPRAFETYFKQRADYLAQHPDKKAEQQKKAEPTSYPPKVPKPAVQSREPEKKTE